MKYEKSIALRYLNSNRFVELDDLDLIGSDLFKTCHSIILFEENIEAVSVVNRIKTQYQKLGIEPPKIELWIVEPSTNPPHEWRKWRPLDS